jgi:rRNA-processing protein FCF1
MKLLVEKNPPFLKKLEKILNGKIFFKVTDCIINELQILGDQFRFVLAEGISINIQQKSIKLFDVDMCLEQHQNNVLKI